MTVLFGISIAAADFRRRNRILSQCQILPNHPKIMPTMVNTATTTLRATSRSANVIDSTFYSQKGPSNLSGCSKINEIRNVSYRFLKSSCTTSLATLSSLNPTNLECLRCPSGVHSVNSIWATSCGLSHRQFFISSLVKAHWVRFRSGRLANGQLSSCSPLNLVATSRRSCGPS